MARGRMSGRARLRRAWLGLVTVLGLSRRGFFIPYRYAHRLPGPGDRSGYPAIDALFAQCRDGFRECVEGLAPLAADLAAIGRDPPPAPRWDQDWFPRLDAAMAYGLVRRHRPRRIVEVGSGHSTRFLVRAVADAGMSCQITAIDPAPRTDLARLPVELVGQAVPAVGAAPFLVLQPGDFLMIDSSHILMPGSDADFLLGQVLPGLPGGVFVHIHDIFLPEDYPPHWDWRGYNEQLGVMQLLLGGGWEVVFASRYVVTRMDELLNRPPLRDLPLRPGAYESSLWLRKRSDAADPPPATHA